MLFIEPRCYEIIMQDALRCYPYECCGFLTGYEKNDHHNVMDIICGENKSAVKEKAFFMSPYDYKNAELEAEKKGYALVGIYHSHPNGEAVPSTTDSNFALPCFSYLIVSVHQQKLTSVKCWRLNEISFFEEENIIINQNKTSTKKEAYGNHYNPYTSA